ncbi:MAG TPA: ABC transporter substrate-binding protein, partial [Myxococcaceae bacterium]|nr:ABC transporter substrate-binding protein [Myxococcaceae bacterium]
MRWNQWFKLGAAYVFFTAACGGEEDLGTPDGGGIQPRPLVIGDSSPLLRDFDPQWTYEAASVEFIQNVSAPLMQSSLGNRLVEPDLATALPQVSEDGLTYTFTLRSGVRFADGTEVTADAFVRSFQRSQLDQGLSQLTVKPFVRSVEAVDAHTVRYNLLTPVAQFPSLTLTVPYVPVNPFFAVDELFSSPRLEPVPNFVRDALAVPDPTKLLG